MELKEKVRRIEEVVNLNNQYIREIWKSMKLLVKNMVGNAEGIKTISESLLEHLDIDVGAEKQKPNNIHKKEISRFYL